MVRNVQMTTLYLYNSSSNQSCVHAHVYCKSIFKVVSCSSECQQNAIRMKCMQSVVTRLRTFKCYR